MIAEGSQAHRQALRAQLCCGVATAGASRLCLLAFYECRPQPASCFWCDAPRQVPTPSLHCCPLTHLKEDILALPPTTLLSPVHPSVSQPHPDCSRLVAAALENDLLQRGRGQQW